MSLQTAISALTPALYWRLNEASGSTTVADSAGGGFPGTVTGDVGLGAFGPELDRTAARIFTGGVIQSPNWGSSTWSAITVMFMASAPFDGSAGSTVPIVGLGDPANPGSKFRLTLTSSSPNNGSWIMVPGTGTQVGSPAVPQPLQNWHHVTFVYTTAPNKTMYLDGVAGTSSATTLTPVPAVGDRWFLESTVPVVVSDFAVFTRALTQLEIQTVSNQVQKWPYQVPINVPTTTGSTEVDLTPVTDDTAQILANQTIYMPQVAHTTTVVDQIKGFWDGYLAVTLPSLNDMLSNILSGLTSGLRTGLETLNIPIGQLLQVATPDFFSPRDLGGGVTCERIDYDASHNSLYGVDLRVTEYPSDWKFTTPDSKWSLRDLAVLTFWLGDEMIERHGVHSTTHVVAPLPRSLPFGAGAVAAYLQPGDYHITVDWAPGVCGQLLGQVLPF